MKQLKKNGFTLIETLIALIVCSIVSLISVLYIHCCLNVIEMKPLHQNQMAILQIRQLLSLAHDIQVKKQELKCIVDHNEIILCQDRNRLVQKDGYVIWMEGVNDIEFKEENDDIYLSWTFQNQRFSSQIH